MSTKPTGRPKGRKDAKPRKKKAVKKTAKKRPAVETPDVKVIPYPRAGENPAFENLLDKMKDQVHEPEPRAVAAKEEPRILTAPDVAELVKWPFEIWAQSQKLEKLRISDEEAKSVADPLTRILERHNVGRFIPPDALDGIQVAARVTPIMTERFKALKEERAKRGTEGSPSQTGKARLRQDVPAGPQGAAFREPTVM